MSHRKGRPDQGRPRPSQRRRGEAARRPLHLPGLETLESRQLLAVTPTLVAGVLDVALSAAGDQAELSVVGSNLDVFDGTSHATFALNSVQGIKAYGTGASGQGLTLLSNVRLNQSLTASMLTSLKVQGSYEAAAIDLQAGEILVSGGTLSTRAIAPGADPLTAASIGDSGGLLLTGGRIEVTASSRLLANADGAFAPGNVKLRATDTKVGENVSAGATVVVDTSILRGGDVLLDADAKLTATASKPLNTSGAHLSLLDVSTTATVEVGGASEVTAAGVLLIGAHSTAATQANALAQSNASSTTIDAALATTKLTSTAIARIGGSSKLSAVGLLSVVATNDTKATTTADGAAAGTNAGGASVAIADVTVNTEAYADGAATLAAGSLQFLADSKANATSTGKATAKAATQNTAATQGTLATQNASTASGPISMAAAVGVLTFNDTTQAYIASTAPILTGGELAVDARSTATAAAVADASTAAPDGKVSGEGVAVAVQHGQLTNRAYVGGTGLVAAQGIRVSAEDSNGLSSFEARALSGPSKKNSSLEGAAAFNIATVTNEAYLATGSDVDGRSKDVTVEAATDVKSTASAAPAPGANPNTAARGIGASLALNIANVTTRAEVEPEAGLVNARNLSVGALGRELVDTKAQAGSDPTAAGTTFKGFAAAVGISLVNATATAAVGEGDALVLGGDLNVDAEHKTLVTNAASGATGGPGVLGAAMALTITSAESSATLDRDLESAGSVALTTEANLATGAGAKALARGGRPESGNPPANAVDQEVGSQIGLADSQAAAAGVPGSNGATAPKAESSDGGMTVAAAVAIDVLTGATTTAAIAPGLLVKAGGSIAVTAASDTDAQAKADGSTTAANATGVGVGIAINAATDVATRAVVGGGTELSAKGLTVQAGMSPSGDGTNTLAATAVSGAGSKKTGIAGGLAIQVAKVNAEAAIETGAVVDANGGDVTLSADERTTAPVGATPAKDGATGEDKGIGVSAAFNIVETGARAEVEDNATLDGAKDVRVSAASKDTLTTVAESGAQSSNGTAVAGSLAATALTATTKARLGTGTPLAATGNVMLDARHEGMVATAAGGTGQGASKAIGISIAFNYDSDETSATTDRSIDAGGGVTLSTRAASLTDAVAKASETGGKDANGSTPSDGATQQANATKGTVDQKAAASGVQGTTAGTQVPDAKTTNGDSLAVAGALAVNLVAKSNAIAAVADGLTIEAGGTLSVLAGNDVDAHAKADGSAKGKATTGVGVGLAINVVPEAHTTAAIGEDATIDVHGLRMFAGMTAANDSTHVVGAEAVSGASASEKAGAGALALSVFLPKSTATIGAGSTVDANGGDLTLAAEEATESQVTATPSKEQATGKSLGVGLSFAINVVEPEARAEIPDTVHIQDVKDVALIASTRDELDTKASAGASAQGGGQGQAGAGSGAASALTARTIARLGTGSELVATGQVAVDATHKDTVKTTAGADSKGEETAVGVSIALSYESVTTTATTDRDIDAGGAVRFASHNASASEAVAKASGSGGSTNTNGSSTGVKDQGESTKTNLDGNAKAAAPGAQGVDANTEIPDAKNSNNDSLTFAGAIALDLPVKVHSTAAIPAGRTVRSGGVLTVSADNDVDAKSLADGTAVGQAKTGVGIGVAITIASDVKTLATIGDGAVIDTHGLVLSAGMSPDNDQTNVLSADATSGASGSDKAVSGAFAMDILIAKTGATVGTGVSLDANGGDVAISAGEATTSTVHAVPAVAGGNGGGGGGTHQGPVLGVGAAIALNIVQVETRAVVGHGVPLLDAHDVSVTAHSVDHLETKATAGNSAPNQADDSTGIGAEAAISVLLAKTEATVGAGGTVAAGHNITVGAEHRDVVSTTGDGLGSGSGTAIGVAFGLTYAESQTSATVGESLTAGNAVTITAENASSTQTTSTASAKGGKAKDNSTPNDGVDVTGQSHRDLADSYATENNGQATGAVKNPEAKTSGGSVAVAGAVALNIVGQSKATASTAPGQFVHAGGPLTVSALNDTDAAANASGIATEQSATGVGVAVALNIAPNVEATATIGQAADIQAKGITIAAGMSDANDSFNYEGAQATSGASASEDAGAGGLALSLFFNKTEAIAGAGSTLDAKGGDVAITAQSHTGSVVTALPAKGAGGKTTGVGISIGVGAVQQTTRAEVEDGVTLSNADDLTISADSHAGSAVTAEAGASASEGDAGAAALASSVVIAGTTARLGTGSDVATTGAVVIHADHDGDSAATVQSDAKGADTVVGIALAINYLEANTTAVIHRDVNAGKAFTIEAHTESGGTASAKASASGAKGKDESSSTADQQAGEQRDYTNEQMTENGGTAADTSQDTSAQTSEGGVSVAGALGLNIVLVHSKADIPDGLDIDAGGKLSVSAWNDADGTAYASGVAAGESKTGIGAAIAINYVEATADARIGDGDVTAKGLLVEAIQGSGNHAEVYHAEAISGAGAKNTGIAGALALNLVKENSHEASLAAGAVVDAKGGDVRIAAASVTDDKAHATPVGDGAVASETGVGASVAANIVLKDVRAEIENGASLVNAGAFAVDANSVDTLDTKAVNGAQGNEAFGISAGVQFLKNKTLARVGTGPLLNATGPATIHAHLESVGTTEVSSVAAGSETALGLSIAVGILQLKADDDAPDSEQYNAALRRSLTAGGAVSVTADGIASSTVKATASATGMPQAANNARNSDDRTGDQFGYADSLSGEDTSSDQPSLKDNQEKADGQTQGQAGSSSKSSVGVAASIAVNVELVGIGAKVDPGLTVTGGGPITVGTKTHVDGTADARGLAIVLSQDETTTVAGAVAVNVALVEDHAVVGTGATLDGNGITVTAGQIPGTTDDLSVIAVSGAGGTGDAGAGSAGVLVSKRNTTATVGANSTLDSGAGIEVAAASRMRMQNLVGGGALGDGNGAGIAIAINVIEPHDTKAIVGTGSSLEAVGPVEVTAQGWLTRFDGSPSSAAVGVAATTDTSVGGSLIIDILHQNTHAIVEHDVTINEVTVGGFDQSVLVRADSKLDLQDLAGGLSVSGGTGVGVGLIVSVPVVETIALLGEDTLLNAGGDVRVEATSDVDLYAIGVAGGIASDNAVSVTAVVFVPTLTTTASIGSNSVVKAMGHVIVSALSDLDAEFYGGALSIGAGNASVGAEVASLGLTQTTEAFIGERVLVVARGRTMAVEIPTGEQDPNGVPLTEWTTGVAVTAVAFQDVTTIAVGGAISDGVSVSGSAAVNVYTITTLAHIDRRSFVDASDANPGFGPSVHVVASSLTDLTSAGGALAGGTNAGVGIGVDVGVITKNTQAFVNALAVKADGDVILKALSAEEILSFSASLSASSSAAIAGAAGVYVVDVTTRAFINDDAYHPEIVPGNHIVGAGGNVQVAARESFGLFMLSGNLTASGSVGVGASASVPVVSKTTEAFLGAGTIVLAQALGGTIEADTGEFGVSYTPITDQFHDSGPAAQKDRKLTDNPNDTLPGQRLENVRGSKPLTKTMKGVAVTATNRDDIQAVGGSAGASGSVSVNVSGAINVLSNVTTAHVDEGVSINPSAAGVAEEMSIQVAAGNDFSFLGIAAGLGVSGSVSVTAGATVLIANQTTTAAVADDTFLYATRDITVEAHAVEDILTVAATVSGAGAAAVGGAFSVIVLNNHTHAYIGQDATNAAEAPVAHAGGNVVIEATDDTDSLAISGGVAIGGGVGAGAAVGVTVFHKDTQAFVGDHATIFAGGNAPALGGLYDGTFAADGSFATQPAFRGLAVQAATSEEVVQVGAEAAGGFYLGLAGGVTVEVFASNTLAYIGQDAAVNTSPGLVNAEQDVSVVAVNRVKDFSLGGGIGVGVVGIGGGVDVGILRNNTAAFIAEGTEVRAADDINVAALSSEDITSYGISGAGGGGAIAGSVSVWSIGSAYGSKYHSDSKSEDAVDSDEFQQNSGEADGAADRFKTVTAAYLDSGNNSALKPAKGIGNAKAQSGARIDAGNQKGLVQAAVTADTFEAGTSATVRTGAVLTAGGDVAVRAADRLRMSVTDGGVAVGFIGIGGAIGVVNVQSHVKAEIGEAVVVDAGGDVLVSALYTADIDGFVMAGKGGIAALGGEVMVIHDDSTQDAIIGRNAQITRARNVGVLAFADRDVEAKALDVSFGGVAVGVTVVDVSLAGWTIAKVDQGAQIGQKAGSTVSGSLLVAAYADNTIANEGYGFAVGVAAGAINHTGASITPVVSATIGENVDAKVGGLIDVRALSFGDSKADLLNGSGGGLSITVMISEVTVSPQVTAGVGGNTALQAGGSIFVASSHNVDVNGPMLDRGAYAHSLAPSGSAISGTGVAPTATANATVTSRVQTGASLQAGGNVGVTADLSNSATAKSESASLSVLGVGVSLVNATANGSAKAIMDGQIPHASNVEVAADASNRATAEALGLGVAIAGAANGATATADASPTVLARIGNGVQASNVIADNDIRVAAGSESDALAHGFVASVSLGASLGVVKSTATVNPAVTATVGKGSKVTSSLGSIEVEAAHNVSGLLGATATAQAPGGGIVSGSGATPTATASATVAATVEDEAKLSTRAGITVDATANNRADADAYALNLGFVTIGQSTAAATASGTTGAVLEGDVLQAMSLSVLADGTNVATADAEASGGGGAALNGADVTATAAPVTTARIGRVDDFLDGVEIDVHGNLTLGANSIASAEVHGKTASGGLLFGVGTVDADASVTAQTDAIIGSFAEIDAKNDISIYARHNIDQRRAAYATAEAPSGGLGVGASGATPTATSAAATHTFIGQRSDLFAGGDISVLTAATGIVEAQAKTLSLGFAALGTSEIQATSNGETTTVVIGQLDGHDVTITAAAIDSGLTTGTSATGGLVSGNGTTATTLLDSTTVAQVGDDLNSASIHSRGQTTIQATAQEVSKAEAKATTVGLAFSLGLSKASATMTSEVGAVLWDGSGIVSNGGINLAASLTLPHVGLSAEAYAESPGGGLISVNGAESTATAKPEVYARADQDTRMNAWGDIAVKANTRTEAQALSSASTFGAGSYGAASVTAEASPHTTAAVLGAIETGRSLLVAARGVDNATARGEAAAVAVIAGVAGASVEAIVNPITRATLGQSGDSDSKYQLSQGVTVDSKETAFGVTEAGGIGLGLGGGIGIADAKSRVAPQVLAQIARDATVTTAGGPVLVQATFDGAATDAKAHATGDGGLAGVQSTNAAASLSPTVVAAALPGSKINAGGSVSFLANATSTATSTADGGSLAGGVGAGGSSAKTTIGGSTTAFTANVASLVARGDLTVSAHDTGHGSSHAEALAGGVLAGVAGTEASTTITRDTTANLDSNGGPILSFGSVLVDAVGSETATSEAIGTTVGGISVGVSEAKTTSTPTVKALIGDGSWVTAAGNATVAALGTNTVDATAHTSAHGAGGIEGTLSKRVGVLDVEALLSPGTTLHAGSVDLKAVSSHNAHGTSNGQAGGFAAGGSQVNQTDLTSTTIARVEDAGAADPNEVVGTSYVTIEATGSINGTTNTVGGAGGAFGGGGAENHFVIHSPLVRASIGNHTTVETDGALEILATDNMNVSSTVFQEAIGGIAIAESTASVEVVGIHPIVVPGEAPFWGELVLTDLGPNVTANVGHLVMHSTQGSVLLASDATTKSFGGSTAAHATARTIYSGNSIVHIATGSDLTSASDIDLVADGVDNVTTKTKAYAGVGFVPPLEASAGSVNEKHSRNCVVVESGVQLTTVNLNVDVDGTIPAGHYIVDLKTEVFGPPFDGTEPQEGSEALESCLTLDADITLTGKSKKKAKVGADGSLGELDGLVVSDASGAKGLGQKLTGPMTLETLRSTAPVGAVRIHVPNGMTMGHSVIRYNSYADLQFVNDSPFALILGAIDLFDDARPEVVHKAEPGHGMWMFHLDGLSNPTSMEIRNLNAAAGGVRLDGSILAPTADVRIETVAGNLTVGRPATSGETGERPFVLARTLSLQVTDGTIGTPDTPLLLRFAAEPGAGFGSVEAGFGAFLDATFLGAELRGSVFHVGNLHAGDGPLELSVRGGLASSLAPIDATWHVGALDSDGSDVTLAVGDPTGRSVDDLILEDAIRAPQGRARVATARGAITSGGPAQAIEARSIHLEGGAVGTAEAPIVIELKAPTITGLSTAAVGSDQVSGVATAGGFHARTTGGAHRVGTIEALDGDVSLTATDTPDAGDDLLLNGPGAWVSAPAGSITLTAGDNLILGRAGTVTARDAVAIRADEGEADPGAGAIVQLDGFLQGSSVTIGTGADDDAIALQRLVSGLTAAITTGAGDDAIYLGSKAVATSATGGAVPVLNGGDLLSIQGDVLVDAGESDRAYGGRDRLVIEADGDAFDRPVSVDDHTIRGLVPGDLRAGTPGPVVTYLNVEVLDLLLGTGDDVLTLKSLNRSTETTIDSGAGDDLFYVEPIGTQDAGVPLPLLAGGTGQNHVQAPGSDNVWEITGLNEGVVRGPNPFRFRSMQGLGGGSGADRFAFADRAGVDGRIDGGEGTDALDYTAYTVPVSVDLRSGAATGVNGGQPGSVGNIEEVVLPAGTEARSRVSGLTGRWAGVAELFTASKKRRK